MNNQLFALLFGLPSFIILSILLYVAIIGTLTDTYSAIKSKNYEYLILLFILTISTAMVGWYLGGII